MNTTSNNSVPLSAEQQGLPLGAALFTVFICILFGANAVAAKISLTGLGVFTLVGIRFSIAAVVLSVWAVCTGVPLRLNRQQFLRLAPLGIIFFAQIALFYVGQNKTTASHGTLIANVLPFIVMILAHFFIPGETIRLQKVAGLVLGFAGVVVLFFDKSAMTSEALHGDLLILAAVMIWSGNVIYVKKIIHEFHSLQLSLFPMIISVPVFLLCGVFFDDQMVRFVDAAVIKSMLYQALVTASFGFVAWNTLMRRFGATALHSFVFIMPISGVFLGVVMLGEQITPNLLAAIALVTAGLVVVNSVGPSRPVNVQGPV